MEPSSVPIDRNDSETGVPVVVGGTVEVVVVAVVDEVVVDDVVVVTRIVVVLDVAVLEVVVLDVVVVGILVVEVVLLEVVVLVVAGIAPAHAPDVIHPSTTAVPAGSTMLVASGGMRLPSSACMRTDRIDRAGLPGATSSAPAMPRSPRLGGTPHTFMAASAVV